MKIMAWTGSLAFPEHIKYLIEHKVSKLNDTSKEEEWLECVAGLRKYKSYIWHTSVEDDTNIFPSHCWTLVHHAAYHKAPISIIQILNVDKYPLSLPDGVGRLAFDHVDSAMPDCYKELLKPQFKFDILPFELKLIQVNFHAVILDRVEALVEKHKLILPVLSVLLEDISKSKECFFEIPGMYGGFTFWIEYENNNVVALWSRSSSRLIPDSEQLHKCTSDGWSLVKKGSSQKNM